MDGAGDKNFKNEELQKSYRNKNTKRDVWCDKVEQKKGMNI